MEDSGRTPWGVSDPLSEYLDPALLKKLDMTAEEATPGCAAYSLGCFQQTERWALPEYRLGGKLAWWGEEGIHERTKQKPELWDAYVQLQLQQYDQEMGARMKTYVRQHGTSAVAYRAAFKSYNGIGRAADNYAIKAMGFLARIKEDMGMSA
jgi:hypothetical protein